MEEKHEAQKAAHLPSSGRWEEESSGGRERRAYSSVIGIVAGNNKVGSLNTGNRDVGSDDINRAVDTREIISRVKPDLLSRLKSVAAGAA